MSKIIRFVAVGDNHGDMVDEKSATQLFKFIDTYQPHEVIHLGDNYDFRSLRAGASGKEESESLDKDIEKGHEFIANLQPTVYHYGNHDDRLHSIIHTTTNAIVKDYCQELDDEIRGLLKMQGCKVVLPYHAEKGVFTLGPIRTVHGYTCGVRAVEEHAIHYAQEGGALLMGHLHSIQQTNAKKFRGAVGFSGGCLCKKSEMRYAKNRLATSKWGTGWLYGYVQGNNWKVWQAHKVGEKFIFTHHTQQ